MKRRHHTEGQHQSPTSPLLLDYHVIIPNASMGGSREEQGKKKASNPKAISRGEFLLARGRVNNTE